MEVYGSVDGLRQSTLNELEGIYDLEVPQDKLWTEELADILARLSGSINREIAVYLDRKGKITDVCVGDVNTVSLNEAQGRRSRFRLSGVRCIHTHPNGTGMLSAVDLGALKQIRLDSMAALGVKEGKAEEIYVAVLSPVATEDVEIFGPYRKDKEDFDALLEYISEADAFLKEQGASEDNPAERAILIGLKTGDTQTIQGVSEADISMQELKELVENAGAQVVDRVIQKRDGKDSAFFVGKGKVEEIRLLVQARDADLVVFDEEISPSQQRNVEELMGTRVIDRTGVILDIFAQRARSREGKIQVELAQLQYMLPRLMGQGLALSRLGGGIGTRGPGETKLETDRRHIKRKITFLKEQLIEIGKQRGILRTERRRNRVPTVSLVGYTNAGKSSLLNALCGADVFAENMLFATLDTTTRQMVMDDKQVVLVTDTVGFIRKLPHNLLDAFKSTLEEAVYADVILIVADASDPYVEDHIRIVDSILSELGAGEKPTLIVYNKIDKLPEGGLISKPQTDRATLEISAKMGIGLEELKARLLDMLGQVRIRLSLRIPFSEGGVLPWLYENGKVHSVDYDEEAALVEAELDKSLAERVTPFLVQEAE